MTRPFGLLPRYQQRNVTFLSQLRPDLPGSSLLPMFSISKSPDGMAALAEVVWDGRSLRLTTDTTTKTLWQMDCFSN